MSTWSNNNLSQVHTWMVLRVLNQSCNTFDTSETIQVKQFTFWNDSDSDGMRETKAKSLAIQIDNIFRQFQGATYEPASNIGKAIDDMSQVLLRGDNTICTLAQSADDNYQFAGELTK